VPEQDELAEGRLAHFGQFFVGFRWTTQLLYYITCFQVGSVWGLLLAMLSLAARALYEHIDPTITGNELYQQHVVATWFYGLLCGMIICAADMLLRHMRPATTYTRDATEDGCPAPEYDLRGTLNRGQKMQYADPQLRSWLRTYVERGWWLNSMKVQKLLVSEQLAQLLLQGTTSLHGSKPEHVYEKMVLLAQSQSVINIPMAQQAKHNIAAATVEFAFAWLYGSKPNGERCVPHFPFELGNVPLPVRY
jgi:hypothetical protein